MKLAFVGPDRTGKSNIAAGLAKKLKEAGVDVPVFKNSGEWVTDLKSEDYFLNLLRFGGPFLMDFIRQTDVSVILDRFYPCEYAYSKAFNRTTDEKTIWWLDSEFACAGGKIIFCMREDYSECKDDVYPDDLTEKKLIEIDNYYKEFQKATTCESMVLYTDDQNLEKQVGQILDFINFRSDA